MDSFKNSFLLISGEEASQKPKDPNHLILEGYRLPDMISLHKALKTGLQLPSYSSPNLDSLDEILNDPDWLESHDSIRISILNYPQLLHLEAQDKKRFFLTILDTMAQNLGYYAISVENCLEIEKDLGKMNIQYHTHSIEK